MGTGGFPLSGGQPASGGVGTGSGGIASGGEFTGSGGVPSTSSYCQVKAIVDAHCGNCHGAERAFGAPMSLVTHADLLANSPIDGRPNYQVMLERVQDDVRPMPQPPAPRLSAAEIQTLSAWVAAGTPDDPNCGATGTGGAQQTGGTGGDDLCIDCGDYACTEGTPIRFLAHNVAAPGDETPYDGSRIGGADTFNDPNLYECFYFKAPWGAGAQSIGFRPVIDNKRILHHWLIYGSDQAPPDITDGGKRSACQLQSDPNRLLLAGWAPGTPGAMMPPDVGKLLPHGERAYITLEIHYYNTEPGKPAPDRSGVEMCIIDTPRKEAAVQHWLGTEKINVPALGTATASDYCTPRLAAGQVSTLISVTPHMHLTGVHGKLELLRQDGTVEVLHNGTFQFDNQTTYTFDTPIKVNSGDRLLATCDYQNPTNLPIAFGEASDEEMCYFYVTAYPAGSLANGRNGCAGPFCVPGGTNRCIDNENILDAIGGITP